jgi:hypothetical protein
MAALCFLLAVITSAQMRVTPVPIGIRIVAPRFDGVIVSPQPGGWRPSPEEILKAEVALERFVPRSRVARTRVGRELGKYKRHYYGAQAGGRKTIRIWGLHGGEKWVSDGTWLKTRFSVAGGGDLFFRATYDLQSDRITEIGINAPK